MTSCLRCATLPSSIPESGTLGIVAPLTHTSGNLRIALERARIPCTEPAPGLLTVSLAPGLLQRLAEVLGNALTRAELRDTRSIILAEGKAPTMTDLVNTQPLVSLFARTRGEWFTQMLRDNRLTCFFHPIVVTEDPSEVFAYECLLRGQGTDGTLISPIELYDVARDADLLFNLDRAARLTAIRTAAEHNLDSSGTRLFINFNPTSIYDPVYCLRSTVAAINATAFNPERIVFEVVESDQIEDIGHLVRIADYYRSSGFKIALDDLGSGYGSLNLLGLLKPDFVKLDMQLIRGVDQDPFKAGIVRKLLEMARDLGVATVAEGIETEGEWAWVREHGADYVQGYLFASPGNPPPRPRIPASAAEPAVSPSNRCS
jgi:EAL domain-containing protein (putative c-di-GMP-specific phosphodiesterase class I)